LGFRKIDYPLQPYWVTNLSSRSNGPSLGRDENLRRIRRIGCSARK
jgi:hypothetical protein